MGQLKDRGGKNSIIKGDPMSVFCALIIVLQSALNIEGCWLAVLRNYAISSNDLLEVVHGPFGGRAALCASSPFRRMTTRKRAARRDQVTVCPCAPTPPTSVWPLNPNDKQMWRIKTKCLSHTGDAGEEQLCCDSRGDPTVLLLSAQFLFHLKRCPWATLVLGEHVRSDDNR